MTSVDTPEIIGRTLTPKAFRKLRQPRPVGGHHGQVGQFGGADPAQRAVVVRMQRAAGVGHEIGAQHERFPDRHIVADRSPPRRSTPSSSRSSRTRASASPRRPPPLPPGSPIARPVRVGAGAGRPAVPRRRSVRRRRRSGWPWRRRYTRTCSGSGRRRPLLDWIPTPTRGGVHVRLGPAVLSVSPHRPWSSSVFSCCWSIRSPWCGRRVDLASRGSARIAVLHDDRRCLRDARSS